MAYLATLQLLIDVESESAATVLTSDLQVNSKRTGRCSTGALVTPVQSMTPFAIQLAMRPTSRANASANTSLSAPPSVLKTLPFGPIPTGGPHTTWLPASMQRWRTYPRRCSTRVPHSSSTGVMLPCSQWCRLDKVTRGSPRAHRTFLQAFGSEVGDCLESTPLAYQKDHLSVNSQNSTSQLSGL